MNKVQKRYPDLFLENSAVFFGGGYNEIVEWACEKITELCKDTHYEVKFTRIMTTDWGSLRFNWTMKYGEDDLISIRGSWPYGHTNHERFEKELRSIIGISNGFSKLVSEHITHRVKLKKKKVF